MYGYLLRAEFEASTGSTWPLNVGQVYTSLARLERDETSTRNQSGEVASPTESLSSGRPRTLFSRSRLPVERSALR